MYSVCTKNHTADPEQKTISD